MSLDASLVGVVFSFILFLIFFSAIILYLAFRIKETFRKEQKRSFLVIKVVFLVGILFLAGGVFYFFANMLRTPSTTPTTPTVTMPTLNLMVTSPASVTTNSNLTISFTITNPTTATAHNTTIQVPVLFTYFAIQSSTHPVVGNAINMSDIFPGTTIVSVKVLAPDQEGVVSDTVSLLFQEMTAPLTQAVSITVTEPPTSTPLLNLTVTYPVSVKVNANLTMSFTITNPTVSTAHDATIQAPVLFTDFTILSSSHTVVSNVISVGDVPPGSTIVSLVLRAPDQIGDVSDTVSLLFQEMTNPITQSISILVTEPPTITPILNLTVNYPASVKMNTNLTITFTITNPTTATAQGATIQAPVLFNSFTIQSSTHMVVGNAISVGDIAPGTTIVAVELLAPNQAGTVSDTVSLLFQEMSSPVTQPVSILVKGGM